MGAMMHRLFSSFLILLTSATVCGAFQAVAYIPHYRIEPSAGAENRLGRPALDAAPDSWDGNIAADAPRLLPERWNDASFRLRLLRDYDEFLLHIPMNSDFVSPTPPQPSQLSFLRMIKDDRPDAPVRVSLLGHSTEFLPVSSREEQRNRFIASLAGLCLDAGLDGIDLDWEFTSAPREDEVAAITALAVGIRQALPDDAILSAAVSRWRLPDRAFFEALDAVHLMAYDGYGRHATYEAAVADASIVMSRFDIPEEKMVLGIPFYGRVFDDRAEDYFSGTMNYRDIVAAYMPPDDADEAGGFFFNGPATVRRKSEWAGENGLRGIFVWEPSYDAVGDRSLSAVIRDVIDSQNASTGPAAADQAATDQAATD